VSGGNVAWLGAEDRRISAMASVILFLSEPALDDMLWGPKSGWGRDVIAKRDAKCAEAKRRFDEHGE
jgi:hypothetical protein